MSSLLSSLVCFSICLDLAGYFNQITGTVCFRIFLELRNNPPTCQQRSPPIVVFRRRRRRPDLNAYSLRLTEPGRS
jgi:hypothetical protein